MAAELENYRGREQSYIKHRFLTQYLQAAAYKTLQGRSPTFNFVDAFAGPWRVSDRDNYSDASFDQALQTLEAVRASLGIKGIGGLKIRFCLCEKHASAVEKLRAYAAQNARYEVYVFHGLFEDHLDKIAAACRDGFTFTFIDPTGWKVRSEPVFEFLRKRRGEFLLNFMAEHVNRHAEFSKVSDSIGRFLADPDWEGEFYRLPSSWNNEQRIMHLLKRKIKATGAATYLPDLPILKPRQQRVKMRLVLGTHSPAGVAVFRDVQARVEREEIATRNRLREAAGPQDCLYSSHEIAAIEQELAGVGCPKYRSEAATRIADLLADRDCTSFDELAIDVLEAIPIKLTDVRKVAIAMKRKGIIAFDLPPRKRVPQPQTQISLVS